jgi:hypothetical protein
MSYYEKHKAERLQYQKEYNALNNDKYLEYQKHYYDTVLRSERGYTKKTPKPPKPIKSTPKPKKEEEPVVIITQPVIEPKYVFPQSSFIVRFD